MRKDGCILAMLLVLLGSVAYGQSSVGALGRASDKAQQVFDGSKTDTSFHSGVWIDPSRYEAPEFPGGEVAIYPFIRNSLVYPKSELEAGKQGRVFVKFVVKENGQVEQVEVARGVSVELDSEAVRIIRAMPVWKPGKLDGKVTSCRMTLPVLFKIDGSNSAPLK